MESTTYGWLVHCPSERRTTEERTFMKKAFASFLLLIATVAFAQSSDPGEKTVRVRNRDSAGVPSFVTGDLGRLPSGNVGAAAKTFIAAKKHLLEAAGEEEFQPIG